MNRAYRRLALSSAVAVTVMAAAALGPGLHGQAAAGHSAAVVLPRANSITYVASSGFLIWAGDKKVLVDALFDGFPGAYAPPPVVQQPLLDGKAPFDGIDLVLATHRHADHFTANAVTRCLRSSPRAAFVAPADAARQVTGFAGRVYPVEVAEGQRTHLEVNGIGIDAMPLSHGVPPPGATGIVNLGYLITIGNRRFFHTGDISAEVLTAAYMKPFNLPAEHIDVAFVPHFLLSTQAPLPLVTESIQPRVVFASHLQYTGEPPNAGRIKRNYPSAVVLSAEMESWPIK